MTTPTIRQGLSIYLATCPSCEDHYQVREKHPDHGWNPPCGRCQSRYAPNQLEERVKAYRVAHSNTSEKPL